MDCHQPVLSARARGMTLVEAVIGLAILSIIMVIAAQTMMSMNQVSAEESAETQVQTDLRRAITEMIFLIEESRPIALWREDQIAAKLPHLPLAPDNTYNYNRNEDLKDRGMLFTFISPLKFIDGRLETKGTGMANKLDHGDTKYGVGDMGSGVEYDESASPLNTYTIFFRPNGEILDEAVEQEDMDLNGVMTDRFVYGGLFISRDDTRIVREITGRIALKQFNGLPGLYPLPADAPRRDRDPRGKMFFLECEDVIQDDNDNGVYDSLNHDKYTETNANSRWDVKMIIRFYFPMLQDDPRRGKVSRLKAIDTRINYFRNALGN